MSKRRYRVRVLACMVGLLPIWAWGCDPGSSADASGASQLVARVAGEEIRAGELDASLRLALHDLARERYKLRLSALRSMVSQRLSGRGAAAPARAPLGGEAELLLAPPDPPRVSLEIEGLATRGPASAPVVVTLFCDFDSRECARLQPTLRVLSAEYSGRVRLAHRDFPMPSGADPGAAAEAAGCAHEQGAFAPYHDALYARPQRRDASGLVGLAGRLELDTDAFGACLDAGGQAARVDESVVMGRHLGVREVPSGFVNGLYVTQADPLELRRLVESELARLGLDTEPERTAASELGLSLVGMVHHRRAAQSLATIRIEAQARAASYRPGETVIADVVLEEVKSDGVVLRRGERSEFLPIRRGRPGESPRAIGPSALPSVSARPPEPEEEPLPEDVRIVRIDREFVDGALARREELEGALYPGIVDPDGRYLLEVDAIEPGDLYDLLGLELGDVLMVVDGELISERENPLWEVLEARSHVELVVARGGEPQIFEIEIE